MDLQKLTDIVRKYHLDGLVEITRAGILSNDFKTTDNRFICNMLPYKVGGWRVYKITINGTVKDGVFTLTQSYEKLHEFISTTN